MRTLTLDDETFGFLAWLIKQDVTLPAVLVEYLKWNRYTRDEVKRHLHALNDACIEAQHTR